MEIVTNKKGIVNRFLNVVERVGNKLPDPTTLFLLFALLILILSFILSKLGVSAVKPGTNEVIEVVNLMNREGLIQIVTKMVSNFTSFAPLGIVLVAMIGVGVAENSGLITALLKKTVLTAPKKLVIPVIVFAALVASVAGDAAFIILPPIAAMIFISLKKHPIVGIVLTYATVAGGLSANVILNGLDVMLYGITESAAKVVDPEYTGLPTMNYYFLIVSTFVLVIVATWVTKKFIEPRFGQYDGEVELVEGISDIENKGLKWAGIVALIYIALMAFLVVPEWGLLRNPEDNGFLNSPFMTGLIPVMFFFFILPGIAYGIVTKKIKSDRDVADQMYKSIADISPFIVLAFVASQMLAYFGWSNIGPIMAIKGAETLDSMNIPGAGMFIGFILISALINIFMGSASAKWVLLAPVFVPMFMYLDYSPAVTQMAYRIGDSITNPITPMFAYFAILLSFAKKYDKNIGIGTLISLALPYSIAFGIMWILLFVIWFMLGLPFGPGETIFLTK